jgi:hypothetical protein
VPAVTGEGLAVPDPLGLVGVLSAATDTSSTASACAFVTVVPEVTE